MGKSGCSFCRYAICSAIDRSSSSGENTGKIVPLLLTYPLVRRTLNTRLSVS